MAMQLVLNSSDQVQVIEALEELGTAGAAELIARIHELCQETEEMRVYRKVAQLDTDDDFAIDDAAAVSVVEEGAWVCGWVWVCASRLRAGEGD